MAKPVILTVNDPQVLRVMGRDTDKRKMAGSFAQTQSYWSKVPGYDGRDPGGGPGLPRGALGRVFELFHTAGRSEPGESRFSVGLSVGSRQNGG